MGFRKLHPPAGARPGTLVIRDGAEPVRIQVVEYGPDTLVERKIRDPEELRAFATAGPRPGGGGVWVDVQGLGDEADLRKIGEIFALHPLALEDAVNVPQRAKAELYDDHLLVIARMPCIDVRGRVDSPQVCLVIGRGYLITFQERFFGFFDSVRERLRAGNRSIRSFGPDYLAYALLDTLIDRYYPIASEISEEIDALEENVLEHPDPEILGRLHVLRREVTAIRRVGIPQRDAIRDLVRESNPFVSDDVRTFLRDTEDHIAQVVELVDWARDSVRALVELYLSSMSHRTNEVMKVLTLMASIFIPLTFLAGIYGMNFEYMPELGSRLAYPSLLALMIAVAAGMVAYFRRRGWIGRR